MRRVLLALVVLLAAAVTAYVVIGEPDAPAASPRPTGVVLGEPRPADSTDGYAPGDLPDHTRNAVEVATEALPLALGYDFRTLDEGLAEATALMTDDFAEEFTRTFEATAAEQAETKDAVTTASVRAAGVVRVEGARVLCLLYVDQVLVSSDTTKDPDRPLQVSQNRVLVGVTDVDGSWLVDSIAPI